MPQKPTGRPFEAKLKEPARLDIRLEQKKKDAAINNLTRAGHRDISGFLRRCIDLLASGEALAIPQLCNADRTREFERSDL